MVSPVKGGYENSSQEHILGPWRTASLLATSRPPLASHPTLAACPVLVGAAHPSRVAEVSQGICGLSETCSRPIRRVQYSSETGVPRGAPAQGLGVSRRAAQGDWLLQHHPKALFHPAPASPPRA